VNAIGQGSTILSEGSTLRGLTLDTSQGGSTLVTRGTTNFENLVIRGYVNMSPQDSAGATLTLKGAIMIEGADSTIQIFDGASTPARLTIIGDTRISGGGVVELVDGGAGHRIVSSASVLYPFADPDKPPGQPPQPDAIDLVNVDTVFRWSGTIKPFYDLTGVNYFDEFGNYEIAYLPRTAPLHIVNYTGGTIESFLNFGGDGTRPLILDGFQGGPATLAGNYNISNAGLIRANNAVGLEIRNSVVQQYVDPFEHPTQAGLFGTIRAEGFDADVTFDNSTVVGGRIEATGGDIIVTDEDYAGRGAVFQSTTVEIGQGETLRVLNNARLDISAFLFGRTETDLHNDGTIAILSGESNRARLTVGGELGGDLTIRSDGFGEIILRDASGSGLRSSIGNGYGGGERLTLVNQGVSGDGDLAVDLELIVDGAVGLRLTADFGGLLDVRSHTVEVRSGSQIVAAGDVIAIRGDVVNEGVIDAEAGSLTFDRLVQSNGTVITRGENTLVTFDGDAFNGGSGSFQLYNGGDFVFNGLFDGAISFGTDDEFAQFNGDSTVVFDDLTNFNAFVSNFSAGDVIALRDIDEATGGFNIFFDGANYLVEVYDQEDFVTLTFQNSFDIDSLSLEALNGEGFRSLVLI
jgi:hypothetical protein